MCVFVIVCFNRMLVQCYIHGYVDLSLQRGLYETSGCFVWMTASARQLTPSGLPPRAVKVSEAASPTHSFHLQSCRTLPPTSTPCDLASPVIVDPSPWLLLLPRSPLA